jgi:hypothetical protein
VLAGDDVAGHGDQRGDLAPDDVAQGENGHAVAAGVGGQRPGAVGGRGVGLGGALGGLELGVGGVGLGGALGGLDPEDLEVGERGAELLFGEGVALLQLTQDGTDFQAQPALLGVGTQEQTDIGWGGWIGIVGHAKRPCSTGIDVDRQPVLGFGARLPRL